MTAGRAKSQRNCLNAPGLTHGHFNNHHALRMIKDLWYKNAIFYCLSVGTYMDSNADGIGDFQGLMRRLDYLSGLGITAIWLMPFQKSPGRDDGYDICDYYNVNPAFGSLGDFVEFTHGAAQRGIRVIIDLVVNHTSNEHPWFQDARRDPDSKYRDWSRPGGFLHARKHHAFVRAGRAFFRPDVSRSNNTTCCARSANSCNGGT